MNDEPQEQPDVVECDDNCGAPLREPETYDDYVKAYEHWRYHSLHYGCSHGR